MNTGRLALGSGLIATGMLLAATSWSQPAPAAGQPDYVAPTEPITPGQAPGLKSKLVSDVKGVKTYVLVFAKNDEVLSGLLDFAQQHEVKSAHFTAIGALRGARVAWLDPERKAYKVIPVDGQLELLSLVGNVALYKGKRVVHAHASVGLPDGQVRGGHLLEAHVWPTVELYLTVEPTPVYKAVDAETGLTLIDLDATR